jgi:hypothetical protein
MILKRTTIFLTEEQHEILRRLAFERRSSMASLLREAALEIIEDEDDIREGSKALSEEEGTVTWQQYQRSRKQMDRNLSHSHNQRLDSVPGQVKVRDYTKGK